MIETHALDGGATLITESNGAMRSLAMQIVVPVGTSRDPEDLVGLAPMCAELLLRGSGDLDSRAHADALDALGVNRSTNAGTHFIRISATMLGTRFDDALDLLVDMVRRPRFDEASIEPVRALALQAIDSIQDDPHERAVLSARGRHHPAPFNRPQSGTAEGVARITRTHVVEHWNACARPEGAIVTLAGAVPDRAVDRVRAAFEGWEGAPTPIAPLRAPTRGYAHIEDDSNQTQVIVVRDAPSEPDPSAMLERVAAKVGQMAGYVDGMVPPEQRAAYEKWMKGLLAAAPKSSPAAIRAVIEEDLGASITELYQEWDSSPIASASTPVAEEALPMAIAPTPLAVPSPRVAALVAALTRCSCSAIDSWPSAIAVSRIWQVSLRSLSLARVLVV